MNATSRPTSELNPPVNITPSVKTTMTGIIVLLPLSLLLLGLFTGFLKL